MGKKQKRKVLAAVAKEIFNEMSAFDDEMFSVHLMKKYKITPEEYTEARRIVATFIAEAKKKLGACE